MATRRHSVTVVALSCCLLAALVGGALLWHRASTAPSAGDGAHSTTTGAGSSKPLTPPKTSVADDGLFLSDVTEADPRLVSYEQKEGDVALRALLTDGSAFCGFLERDGTIDDAMVSVAVGAQQDEAQTHLPLSVTTFNAVDAVALLTLCPSLQKDVPASDLAKIRELGVTLSESSK